MSELISAFVWHFREIVQFRYRRKITDILQDVIFPAEIAVEHQTEKVDGSDRRVELVIVTRQIQRGQDQHPFIVWLEPWTMIALEDNDRWHLRLRQDCIHSIQQFFVEELCLIYITLLI